MDDIYCTNTTTEFVFAEVGTGHCVCGHHHLSNPVFKRMYFTGSIIPVEAVNQILVYQCLVVPCQMSIGLG